jgi:uncharacterized protein (TIGR04551 family)
LDLADLVAQSLVLHGYFRTRAELFHNLAIGWDDPQLLRTVEGAYASSQWPWVRNPENGLPRLCSTDPPPRSTMRVPAQCNNNSQTSANMRFRLNPEIHITDSIRVLAQIDILDNLILGSTPQGYYTNGLASPWAPITGFASTQVVPNQYNSYASSIAVSRAWAEVTHPSLGQLRFGRMPSHWGLGILANAGNGIDSDYQSHADRILYAAAVRSLGLFFAAMWDFASTGASSISPIHEPGQGQPYDLAQLDDVHQWNIALGRRLDPSEVRLRLARGDLVWNGGLYGVYRYQTLSGESFNANAGQDQRLATDSYGSAALLRRDARAFIGDLWFQLLGPSFRFELESAVIYGATSIDRAGMSDGGRRYDILQFGGALEFEYRLMNNRLALEFRSGFATGDSDLEGLTFQTGLLAPRRASATSLSLFRFHPDYRVDLILWRQVMKQVSGAYYFRPGVSYAFVDHPGADRFWGRAAVIWSRASEFVQTRGNAADLGLEADLELTYQSNFRHTNPGEPPAPGFFASLQYGVMFPMAGLGPRTEERQEGQDYRGFSFSTAHTLRGILGVMF